MGNICLHDKNVYPGDEVLTQYLGPANNAWHSFIDLLKDDYPALSAAWRYYNDGKRWLCKVTKKSKTICWLSIWQEFFKITFYFSDKAEEAIKNSSLEKRIKELWLNSKKNSKFRPITIEVKKSTDLKTIKKLIELKENIK